MPLSWWSRCVKMKVDVVSVMTWRGEEKGSRKEEERLDNEGVRC